MVVGMPAACTSLKPLGLWTKKIPLFLAGLFEFLVICFSFFVAVIVVFLLLGGREYVLCLSLSMIILLILFSHHSYALMAAVLNTIIKWPREGPKLYETGGHQNSIVLKIRDLYNH